MRTDKEHRAARWMRRIGFAEPATPWELLNDLIIPHLA